MRAMLAVILVCCAVTGLQAADLQNIENARPLNVDLSSQSDTALANSAGTEIDEDKLGGYRPLYPPYFLREPATQPNGVQPKSVYYDQEYYTRGTPPGITDDRLGRRLKIAAGSNPFLPRTVSAFPSTKSIVPEARPDVTPVQTTLTGVQPALIDDRNHRQIKISATNPFLSSIRPAFSEAGPLVTAVQPTRTVVQPVPIDDRNNRQIKISATNPFLLSIRPALSEAGPVVNAVQPTRTGVQPVPTDDRNNRQIKITNSHFSHAASSSFSSSYSFHNVKFPSS